jgi:organic radical activating enzyme
MQRLRVELAVTFKCNWDCTYCLVDTHNQPTKPFSVVKAEAHAIPPYAEVTLSGGEPGLLPRAQLLEIISILRSKSCSVDLLTNGLFFNKHIDLIESFDKITYHCIESFECNTVIEYPAMDQRRVTYALVVVDEDLQSGNLLQMLNKHPDIQFLILPDIRRMQKINLVSFMKFLKEHEKRLHRDTRSEFLGNLSRTWGQTRV